MIPSELLKKIRKIEIKTRRIVNSVLAGEYHSAFKGQGISFSEVREYYHGDDVRRIDWNISAKLGHPYIKLFEEERELTVILAIDISGSSEFGSVSQSKGEIMAEIAAVLGFSAIHNQDKVGLLLFSDTVERYIPPKKGKQHVLRILRDLFYFKPESKRTSISNALKYLQKIQRKRAIVFLISDFQDVHYEKALRLTKSKHDLIPILIEDPREKVLPNSGLVRLEDDETGDVMLINMSSADVRKKFQHIAMKRELDQNRLFKSIGVAPIRISVDQPYLKPLMSYFEGRRHG